MLFFESCNCKHLKHPVLADIHAAGSVPLVLVLHPLGAVKELRAEAEVVGVVHGEGVERGAIAIDGDAFDGNFRFEVHR